MKTRLQILMTMGMLLVVTFSFSQTTVVSSLAALRSAVQNSNQDIVMTSGNYDLEDLATSSRNIIFSGSNNTVDLTGVYVEVAVGSVSTTYIFVSGSDNTIIGGEFEDKYRSGITEVTDFEAYNADRTNLANGLGGDAVMQIDGDDNIINGLKLTTRGSFPFGYGSLFGIGSGSSFGLDKRCALLVNSVGNTLENIEIQHQAFGHAIFFQADADDNLVKNCLIEGLVRHGSDIVAEGANSLPGRNSYLDNDGNAIDPSDVVSLGEDGIRSYGNTGSVTVEGCTVNRMRAGIKLYLASSATVTNTSAIDCGDVAFNMPSNGVITNSTGNFAYEELSDFAGNRNGIQAEWTIVSSPHATGSHNIADISNNDHNLVFHRVEGAPVDTTTRAIVVTGSNSTIVNETEYAIILESGTSGNTITSCGPVTDNGSNSVTLSSNCFSDAPHSIGVIQAEDYHDMNGIQTENTGDTGGGENVGWIDAGDWMEYDVDIPSSGTYTVNYRVASKNGGGSVQFQENGNIKATTSISSTGNWQNWTTISTSVSLSSGTQTIRLHAAAGGWNINWFEIVGGFTCASFSTIEAEDFDSQSGVVDEGSNIGNVHNGDWTMYNNVDLTCATSIDVRASSRNNSGNVEVRLGSTTGTLIGTVGIATTGNWNTWVTSSTSLASVSGVQDVYLVFTGGSSYLFNVDWIEFSDSSSAKTSGQELVLEEAQSSFENRITVSPNPVSNLLTVDHLNSNFNEMIIYNYSGSVVVSKKVTNQEKTIIDLSHLSQGLYILRLNGAESSETFKLRKK